MPSTSSYRSNPDSPKYAGGNNATYIKGALKDKTNSRRSAPTRIPKYQDRARKMEEANNSMSSEDSWDNDEEEKEYRDLNDSDVSDERNVSIFSEQDIDGEDEASYPDDNDEYLMNDFRRDVSKALVSKPKKSAAAPARRPESNLSILEKTLNAAKFHKVSHLMMAPPEVPSSTYKDMVKCVIIRDKKSTFKSLYPRYTMYFQDGCDQIALCAEKQGSNRTANYHIFDMSRGAPGAKLNKKAGNYLGKLRGNRSGTEYTLLNNSTMKEQVAGFVFDKISLTKQLKEGQIPRRLHCLLPPLAFDSTAIPYKINSDSDMVERFQNGIPGKMSVLNTKEPTFERGQYRLNFHGRVTTPSVKNFQIVDPSSRRDIIAQFGRVTDTTFHLDFKRPLCAFQAFGMALAQFNL